MLSRNAAQNHLDEKDDERGRKIAEIRHGKPVIDVQLPEDHEVDVQIGAKNDEEKS